MKTLKFVNLITGGGTTNLEILKNERRGGKLYGITQTKAIISSSPTAKGIARAIKLGFCEQSIHIVNEKSKTFLDDILAILAYYEADFFHQVGFMPWMSKEVIAQYMGLNQHLGPGGQGMFGERRVYAHMRFCQEVGRLMPIQVFCQLVHPIYDAGKIVYDEMVELDFKKTPEQNAETLLSIEHQVQISGRLAMYYGIDPEKLDFPINIAQDSEEEALLEYIKKEAIKMYPRGK